MKRVKVTFRLKLPVVILDQRTTLDGILAGVMFRVLMDKGMEQKMAINYARNNLPIRKFYYNDSFFYVASCPLMDTFLPFPTKVFRKTSYLWAINNMERDDVLTILKILDQANGPWKMLMNQIDACYTREVSFIAEIDNYTYFRELVDKVQYIGKKSSYGYGIVKECFIKDVNAPIERPVPIISGLNYTYPIYLTRPLPPYWEKGGRILCGMAKI